MRQNDDFVAQLVEQLTLNQWAEGSSPSEVTENKPPTFVGGFLFMLVFLLFKQVVLTIMSRNDSGNGRIIMMTPANQ